MVRLAPNQNIVLIGMPGVGKSTVGVLLAKATGRGFADTDLLLQSHAGGRTLQEMIESDGLDAFCRLEERLVLGLACTRSVIATGGSVVYSRRAMEHLKRTGPVVLLHLDVPLLRRRIGNMSTRGIVMPAGQTLEELYHERRELYRHWADVTIDCGDMTQDELVAAIMRMLPKEP